MSNRRRQYLVVYDVDTDSFREGWRIVRRGDRLDPVDSSELNGTVNEAHVEDMTKQLRWTYPEPRHEVSTFWAATWDAVRREYRGPRDHDGIPGAGGTAGDPPPAPAKRGRRDRTPSRRDSAPAATSSEPSLRDRWTRLLLTLYLLTALIGAGVLVHTIASLPAVFPTLELTEDQNLQSETYRIREWVAVELPVAADWLAPSGLFSFEDDMRRVLTPGDWEIENVSLAERVERLNRSIEGIREDYVNAASLLGVVFFGGFFFACLTLARPNLGTAFAICLFPLFTTPIATEPLIGVDNMHLFYLTLPMLIGGGGVLVIESVRAIGASVLGPRSEAWMRIWIGVWIIAVGAAATALSAALSESMNAGIVVVAVGPVLYGVFSLLWGLGGLLRSLVQKRRQ